MKSFSIDGLHEVSDKSPLIVVFKTLMFRRKVSFRPCSGRGRPVLLVDFHALLDPLGGLPRGFISLLVPCIKGSAGVDADGEEVVVLGDVAILPKD